MPSQGAGTVAASGGSPGLPHPPQVGTCCRARLLALAAGWPRATRGSGGARGEMELTWPASWNSPALLEQRVLAVWACPCADDWPS